MFYVYTILIPSIILVLNYWAVKSKPKKASEYVNFLFRTLPHMLGYMFFLYYLEREKDVHTGGADLGLFIFLIPVTVIMVLLKFYYFIKGRKSSA